MNKLIELLNEYGEIRKYNNVGIIEWVEHTKGNLYWKYWENTWSYMVVISKEFGFIKWLVDKDKIDFNKRPELYTFKAETETRWLNNMVDGSGHYESLLMLLSIQDNPIEFLISLLK